MFFTRFSKLILYVFDVTLLRSSLSINRLELRYHAAGAEKQTHASKSKLKCNFPDIKNYLQSAPDGIENDDT